MPVFECFWSQKYSLKFQPKIKSTTNFSVTFCNSTESGTGGFLWKRCFENFAKFTGKHLCQGLFFNKVTGLRPATLFKKRQWHRYFPVNFAKFLRTSFLQNTSRRLLPPIFLTKWTSLCLCQKGNTLPLRKKCPYLEFFRSGFFEDLRF